MKKGFKTSFGSVDEILKCDNSNTFKYFLLVLFIMVYEVDRSLESVEKILSIQKKADEQPFPVGL